jgi:hypothetical protein
MAKKMRKFGDGGDIMVKGVRPQENIGFRNTSGFNLASMGRGMNTGIGGGGGSQRLGTLTAPSTPVRAGPTITPAVVRQSQSDLGSLVGAANPPAYGANFRMPFKKGGKVKKMAKGGSTASKRADGCATKGKTKGRFV